MSRDDRNNPAPYYLKLPLEGVVVQQVTLQHGVPDNDYEYGSSWNQKVSNVGYKVAYHLNRRPLTVLPSLISSI